MEEFKKKIEEKFDRTCKTNLGRIDLSELEAGGSELRLTRIQMGKGLVDPSTDIQEFTELVDPVQYNDINSANTLVRYQTTIAFRVRGSDIVETFKWSELGIFARLNDGEEFLIAYAYSSNPDILVKGSKVTDQYVFGIRFENSNNVTVELHVDQTVPLHAATHLDNDVDPIPTVSSERTGLVPVGPDDARMVLVGNKVPQWGLVPLADTLTQGAVPALPGLATKYLAGDGRWHRTTPFIMRDTTLYVDPDNRDNPPKFSTLAKALEYLGEFQIFIGVTVTVELADGTHKIDDVIKFDHPQARQVRIVGASQRQQISFSDLTVSGDDLVLKASSVKGLKVGMSVIIDGTDLQGGCKGGHTILGIQGSSVRVSGSNINNRLITNQSNLKTSSMFFYRTKVHCIKGGIDLPNGLGPSSLFDLSGSWSVGKYGCNGLLLGDKASFSSVIVSGFHRGVFAYRNYTDLNFVAAHDCMDGVIGNVTTGSNLYCNGNSGAGLWAYQNNMYIGGYVDPISPNDIPRTYLNGNKVGLLSDSKSHVMIRHIISQLNRSGIRATFCGSITFGASIQSHINVNTEVDVSAYDGGFIRGYASGGPISGCSPLNGEVGNAQSYILISP